jgi:hypothetical protein
LSRGKILLINTKKPIKWIYEFKLKLFGLEEAMEWGKEFVEIR